MDTAPRSRYNHISITGLEHVDAPLVVTSRSIDEEIAPALERHGMPEDLLANLTGIEERRFWEVGHRPSDAAALAAQKLLDTTDIDPDRIGLLINTSVSRDHLEPSTASIVQGKLGLGRNCLNFDLGSACLGFLQGAIMASALIERGDIEHALIVDGEDCREIIESTIERMLDEATDEASFREQFACLTLGSAGVAMLLSKRDPDGEAPQFIGGLSVSATEHNQLSIGDPTYGRTDSQALLLAGLDLAKDGWQEAADAFDWSNDTVSVIGAHQVSRIHTDMLIDRLGFDGDKVPRTYPLYGNTGPASVPTVLSKEADAGRLERGDRIVLIGMGSGINASAVEVRW